MNYYRKARFSNYVTYCNSIRTEIKSNNLSYRNKLDVLTITDELQEIFSMTEKDLGKYISDFFILEKYMVFEYLVRMSIAAKINKGL